MKKINGTGNTLKTQRFFSATGLNIKPRNYFLSSGEKYFLKIYPFH
jgi:hypothetical protein